MSSSSTTRFEATKPDPRAAGDALFLLIAEAVAAGIHAADEARRSKRRPMRSLLGEVGGMLLADGLHALRWLRSAHTAKDSRTTWVVTGQSPRR